MGNNTTKKPPVGSETDTALQHIKLIKRLYKETAAGEQELLKAMQQHLLDNLPTSWDALHPEEHQQHPTLWEQLLGMADGGKDYGVDKSQYAAVALEAIATTYGLELAMSNRDHAGIRTIAELVGVPYHLLLQKYITKYGDKNNGKHYKIREQETAGTADAGR